MSHLSESFVIGLLADLEVQIPEHQRALRQAKQRAQSVDAEISNLVMRLDMAKTKVQELQSQHTMLTRDISECNMAISQIHQEIAGLKKRSEEIKIEMDRVGQGAIQRRLRRERAKLSIQMEDRNENVQRIRDDAEIKRQNLQTNEEKFRQEQDRRNAITMELDHRQGQLPSPWLFVNLFYSLLGRAHCHYYLERNHQSWQQQVRFCVEIMINLHRDLKSGKYRLDKNSELIGGRCTATAEAIYGAVAIGDLNMARELFELATDPSLYFHQIYNVFRIWCLGLFLQKRDTELRELLRLHQHATGLRGGYGQTFIGFLLKDRFLIKNGLATIRKYEAEAWQDPNLVRAVGVVNVGVFALSQISEQLGVSVPGYLLSGTKNIS